MNKILKNEKAGRLIGYGYPEKSLSAFYAMPVDQGQQSRDLVYKETGKQQRNGNISVRDQAGP